MPNYEDTFRTAYENVFTNCISLEEIYLPNAIYIPQIFPIDEENGSDKMKLRYVYAPKAYALYSETEAATFYCCGNLEWLYLPSLEYVTDLMFHKHPMTIFLSDKLLKYDNNMRFDEGTTIVAPENSQAHEMAKKYGLNFISSERLSFTGTDNENFIYSTPDNQSCTMPIVLVEQMWYDYLPINNTPDFMDHGYLLDVVPDEYINGKDFAKIHHVNKWGW